MLNTGYSIWLANRIFFGDIKLNKNNTLTWINYFDLNILEINLLSLLCLFIVYFGIYPNLLLPF
jgi:NADH:ubiquinone oxidoreductase subunit 4 (subunit M)